MLNRPAWSYAPWLVTFWASATLNIGLQCWSRVLWSRADRAHEPLEFLLLQISRSPLFSQEVFGDQSVKERWPRAISLWLPGPQAPEQRALCALGTSRSGRGGLLHPFQGAGTLCVPDTLLSALRHLNSWSPQIALWGGYNSCSSSSDMGMETPRDE